MICEYCDNPVPAGATRCPSCGAAVAASAPTGAAVSVQAVQNVQQVPVIVGVPYAPNATPQNVQPVQRKSRIVYIVLGWFLGFLGIHNFYAGWTQCAVAQLAITVLFGWLFIPLIAVGIWILIELCTVKIDGHGIPMTD